MKLHTVLVVLERFVKCQNDFSPQMHGLEIVNRDTAENGRGVFDDVSSVASDDHISNKQACP